MLLHIAEIAVSTSLAHSTASQGTFRSFCLQLLDSFDEKQPSWEPKMYPLVNGGERSMPGWFYLKAVQNTSMAFNLTGVLWKVPALSVLMCSMTMFCAHGTVTSISGETNLFFSSNIVSLLANVLPSTSLYF